MEYVFNWNIFKLSGPNTSHVTEYALTVCDWQYKWSLLSGTVDSFCDKFEYHCSWKYRWHNGNNLRLKKKLYINIDSEMVCSQFIASRNFFSVFYASGKVKLSKNIPGTHIWVELGAFYVSTWLFFLMGSKTVYLVITKNL